MKKAIYLLILILMASFAMAIPFPQPLVGKVTLDKKIVQGIDIGIKNLRTGRVMTVKTDSAGFYIAELSGFVSDSGKDRLEITACSNDANCVKNVLATGDPIRVDFNLAGSTPVFKIGGAIGALALIGGGIAYAIKRKRGRPKKIKG